MDLTKHETDVAVNDFCFCALTSVNSLVYFHAVPSYCLCNRIRLSAYLHREENKALRVHNSYVKLSFSTLVTYKKAYTHNNTHIICNVRVTVYFSSTYNGNCTKSCYKFK